MQYTEIDTRLGVTGYTINGKEAHLTAVRGRDSELEIPEYIEIAGEQVRVTDVGRKAFLSDKYLHHLVLPASVESIGDWGLAGCRNLESVTLSRHTMLGNGTFKDCEKLNRVILCGSEAAPDSMKMAVGGDRSQRDDVSYLLAAVIRLMNDRYLFDLREAGSSEWYKNWDMRMRAVLDESDEDGFSALIACGEEDYEGKDGNLDTYTSFRRKRKVRICMIRLLHDNLLGEDDRRIISDYLYSHRAGTDMPETWTVVREEHGDSEDHYRLMCDLGCVDPGNIDTMLNDLGDSHPGMKAFLIRYIGEESSGGFLDDMML
ncbi:MAG: leucine-rich repeat protein [Lachnospiraceae bacterium]|nr:leucine-rich repeat protein [Lachnospiraceae bacterium]